MFLFILSIVIIGASGLIAQALLLRELLINFYGNELTLGIILSNWVISEGIGALVIGKFIDRIKNKINIFVILQLAFSITLIFSLYFSRVFKGIIGIPFGEAIGLSTIFFASFLILLPVSFCHGALFSSTCKLYSLYSKKPEISIAKVYAWETIGTLIGGIAFTYLFIPALNSFQAVFILAALNTIICLFFLKDTSKILKYISLFFVILISCLYLKGAPNYLQNLSINKQWQKQQVLDYKNSIYGNIAVTKEKEQTTFYYNGIPVVTVPYPNITFVEEFANLPMLFHHSPKDILIINAGAGGVINEILKYPARKIDYAEIDPLIITMLKEYPSEITQKELADKRVNIINIDGRAFIKNTINRYDIILIGLPGPSDIAANRFFTEEFFSLAKNRLNSKGILIFCLPGSLTYLSMELKNLNKSIYNGLKNSYKYTRIIPGDYNMYLASQDKDILETTSGTITQKINQLGIKTRILTPAYIDYRLNKQQEEWLNKSFHDSAVKTNQDFMPSAVFEMLLFWNNQFSPSLTKIISSFKNLKMIIVFISLIAFPLFLFLIFYRSGRLKRLSFAYILATSGFFLMLVNLILLFSFQAFYGYLYHKIGLFISILMAGIAIGSISISKILKKDKNNLHLLLKIEFLILSFSCLLAFWINNSALIPHYYYSFITFMALFLFTGILGGMEFSLVSKIYLTEKKQMAETAGLVYFSDLFGGWLAGITGSIILLPTIGFFNTCLVIITVKTGSFLLLYIVARFFN